MRTYKALCLLPQGDSLSGENISDYHARTIVSVSECPGIIADGDFDSLRLELLRYTSKLREASSVSLGNSLRRQCW